MKTTSFAVRASRTTAACVAAVALVGIAAPAASAAEAATAASSASPIAPAPDAWGRYYVDAWASNATENSSPETNAAIGLLSTMTEYW
ncbi:hypothetical protein [Microbacterium sp. CH12i]|uniref:hypothetical protein n=1 Tax=Microbacterium sp. CH12i TaxID=1479651 RepID=UPI0006921AFD|nr:hypothetical protein [Microbacterium sp. CH12i]